MSEFFIELLTEEIPARMQVRAAADFKKLLEEQCDQKSLSYDHVVTYVTPRRLVAVISGVPLATEAQHEERRGPRLDAPDKALDGFLRSLGLQRTDCTQKDGYWYASLTTPAQQTKDLWPDLVRQVLRAFSWPKSMRWPGALIPWVRPVRSMVTLFAGEPLIFDVPEFGLQTGVITRGHRFLSPDSFSVTSFKDYKKSLSFVILDHEERKRHILSQLKSHDTADCHLQEDSDLLEEVAGLSEYPTVYVGRIKNDFMTLPKEVLSTSMRVHQKYFTYVNNQGQMAPVFGFVSNIIPSDDGHVMKSGYERVLDARLSDAAFFFEQDLKNPLVNHLDKLYKIIFHAKLGSVGQKIRRLQGLVETENAKRAALLCKTDLVTLMVGEFPELQGIMGAVYAQKQGEHGDVVAAIREHYAPQGPLDACPQNPVSVEVAIADKVDTLVGFFAIGEVPTGSKDPYALRRAALGLIRLIRENKMRNLDLKLLCERALTLYKDLDLGIGDVSLEPLFSFIQERLGHALKQEGIRHDCIRAAFGGTLLKTGLDVYSLVERAVALDRFLKTEEGNSLQMAFRRSYGVLAEGQEQIFEDQKPDESWNEKEQTLYATLYDLQGQAEILFERHAYDEMMSLLARLKSPVDDFFELRIQDDDLEIRGRRLGLLRLLTQQVQRIADFRLLEV